MAKSKEDITYGTAQAKLSEDEALRVRYKHGTPLEGGKIADSEPVDLFSSAHNVSNPTAHNDNNSSHHPASETFQSQLHHQPHDRPGAGAEAGGNVKASKPNTSSGRRSMDDPRE